jgi:hypothetical protein
MNPDPIIGRVLFTDGILRPVFRDDAGSQYVIDRDGHTRRYGVRMRVEDEADRIDQQTSVPRRACVARPE